jgi:hypothetical protein
MREAATAKVVKRGHILVVRVNLRHTAMHLLPVLCGHNARSRAAMHPPPETPAPTGCWTALLVFVCGGFVICSVLTTGRAGAVGRLVVVSRPVVHRMYTGAPAVPASAWEAAGFEVRDAGAREARAAVGAWGAGALRVYDSLPDNAARADLYRYVAVYTEGGWYAAADVRPLWAMHDLARTRNLVLFHGFCGGPLLRLSAPMYTGAVFAAPRGWAALKAAVASAMRRSRGPHMHLNTAAFNDAVQMHLTLRPGDTPTVVPCSRQIYFRQKKN